MENRLRRYTWHEIIVKMCQYNLPIFLASGASDLDEVKMAVKLIKKSKKIYV